MRCFFALPIPVPVQQNLADALADWRRQWPAVQWETAAALHLTLQFVGDWPADRTQELAAAAAAVRWSPFTLQISGVGAFPDLRRPRLLWAGVEQVQPLLELVGTLAARLSALDIQREDRPFRPHISLGRVTAGAKLGSWAPAAPASWGRLEVTEFGLYETVAGLPPAERYQVRACFPATSSSQAR
jgi:2'-5' RNA ligase